jgi:uncharacterized damage-inducible protein DinB
MVASEALLDIHERAHRGLRKMIAHCGEFGPEELNSPRTMKTWRDEVSLRPAHVVLRTQTHIFQHQGQVTAMCRLLGRPLSGIDFPID